jgi:transcriptional regulator with XRE-family HTH domain
MKRPSSLRGRIHRQTRLGEMLRLYRTVRHLTLRRMAPDIGIGYATLARIEMGEAFDAETLLKLWTWLLATEPS